MEYKRLTRKIINKYTGNQYTACEYNEIYQNGSALCQVTNRLGELEDKIENGTLIELPRLYIAKEGCYTLYVINYLSEINGRLMEYSTLDKEQAEAKLKELTDKTKTVCPVCGKEMDETYHSRQYCKDCESKLKGEL